MRAVRRPCNHPSVPRTQLGDFDPATTGGVWGGRRGEAEYIQLVDYTGRQIRPDKRGAIHPTEPPALRRLGLDASHWTGQVKGVGSAYWRIVGGAEAIMEKAQAIGQAWMKGIGYARWLEKLS